MISDNTPTDPTDDALPADEDLKDSFQNTATDVAQPSGSPPPATPERYAALELEHDAVIIYDRENPAGWIQSDRAIQLGNSRE